MNKKNPINVSKLNEILGVSILSPERVRVKQNAAKDLVEVNYHCHLEDYQLKKLLELGEVEIKRSGPGLKIVIKNNN